MSDSIACGNDMTASARLASGGLMALVFSLGLLVLALAADAARAAEPLDLSDDERAFIAAQNAVSIGLVADNEPYSFHLNGKTMGWSVDVIDAISELTGLKFEKRLGSWPEIFGQFRRGRLDVIADISYTEARSAFIGFTGPYHLRRTVLFENIDRPIYNADDLESLKSKRIGVIRDIYYAGALEQAGFQLQEYATYRDLMAAVAFGWVDGALAAELTGNFFVRENGFTNVVSAGALPLTEVSLEDFRLGVLDDPDSGTDTAMLLSILRKAVLALPAGTLDEITERWLAYRANRAVNAPPLRLLPEEQAFIRERPSAQGRLHHRLSAFQLSRKRSRPRSGGRSYPIYRIEYGTGVRTGFCQLGGPSSALQNRRNRRHHQHIAHRRARRIHPVLGGISSYPPMPFSSVRVSAPITAPKISKTRSSASAMTSITPTR